MSLLNQSTGGVIPAAVPQQKMSTHKSAMSGVPKEELTKIMKQFLIREYF